MPHFKTGDRVRRSDGTSLFMKFRSDDTIGTVGALRDDGRSICIRFDNSELDRRQSYKSGWYSEFFEHFVDDPVEPEDWS